MRARREVIDRPVNLHQVHCLCLFVSSTSVLFTIDVYVHKFWNMGAACFSSPTGFYFSTERTL